MFQLHVTVLLIIATLALCLISCQESEDEPVGDTPLKENDVRWLNTLFKLPSRVRVRKEYRTLSDEDRHRFHRAFQMLKKDTSVNPNKYDLLARLHHWDSTRFNAHQGPSFLPWHRVYNLLAENALREKIPDLTIPYWDTTLDYELQTPNKSILWSQEFMGNIDGTVFQGPFAYWTTYTEEGLLHRAVGEEDRPMSDEDVKHILARKHIRHISHPLTRRGNKSANIEYLHNIVHRWVGGDMFRIPTAANDPVFFIFHAFVDCLWEEFRALQRASGIDPLDDYTYLHGDRMFSLYSPLGLGNIMIKDALSDVFSANIQYIERPCCNKSHPDCGSSYLRCNVEKGKCVSLTIEEYDDLKASASLNDRSFHEEVRIVNARLFQSSNTDDEGDSYGDSDEIDDDLNDLRYTTERYLGLFVLFLVLLLLVTVSLFTKLCQPREDVCCMGPKENSDRSYTLYENVTFQSDEKGTGNTAKLSCNKDNKIVENGLDFSNKCIAEATSNHSETFGVDKELTAQKR